MKEPLQKLLARVAALPGVAAWGARLSDQSTNGHCFSDWFTRKQVEQVLLRLARLAEILSDHRIEPLRLCWKYDRAIILIGMRNDGACLAFFLENRPEVPMSALEAALQEFASMDAGI